MKVAFYTLGCKVNQYETNAMSQAFIENGYSITGFEEEADIYIINTCTVTNIADRKSRQMLRRAKQLNPNSIIVAVGCYAQTHKEQLEKIEEIDLILGNNEKNTIVEIIEDYLKINNEPNAGVALFFRKHAETKCPTPTRFGGIQDREYKVQVSDIDKQKEFLDFGTVTYTEKTRASIKVQDGCNNFCSYCLIPYARGRIRSRKKESVLKEINEISKTGIKEVVITGIHIASYGKDFNEKYRLIDLLEDINKIEGIKRIRLGSLEPNIITKDFVIRLSKLEKICNHFHLSLQSGCNETLKRMNRKYTIEQIEDSVNLLREKFQDVVLTTDIIVGFPGETETEFLNTYNFLRKLKLTKMHIFKYSPREGTRAEVMPNQIDGNIKEQRSQDLIELSNKNEQEFLKEQIGKELEVLFEEQEGIYWKGHTKNYLVVKKEDKCLENMLKNVNVIEIKGTELIAK